MNQRPFSQAFGAIGLLLASACSTPQKAPTEPQTPISREVALASFDETWNTVELSDFDSRHGGVDWMAVKLELRPKAEKAASREELRLILSDMLSRLHRSHYGLIPAESVDALPNAEPSSGSENDPPTESPPPSTSAQASSHEAESPAEGKSAAEKPAVKKTSHRKSHRAAEAEASFGLTLRWIEDAPIVTGVRDHSPAQHAGVRLGWKVKSIDGVEFHASDANASGEAAKYVKDLILQSADAGDEGSEEAWIFEKDSGETQALSMTREPNTGISTKLGLLPPFQARCDDRVLSKQELRSLSLPEDLDIAVIAFNIWMPAIAQSVDDAFQRHLDADGLIIDLRGNPGGAGGMVMGIAGHVIDEPLSLGTMRTRDTTLEFKVNPRRSTRQGESVNPFSGPVAVVVDPLSASTSEIFAGGLQKLDRARVFGRTSAGAALPAQMKSLASGDAILYAFANYTLPDGSTIEGAGVIPDEPTGTRRGDWSRNRDADVDAAARWISSKIQAEK